MNVFISWSGERSKKVAECLYEWLKGVIQSSKPFLSSKDIESGSWWFTEIADKLAESNIGIICITNENKDKPWILFEAGALSKGLSKTRAMPFLIDVAKTDLRPPLAQLHLTGPTQEEMFSLAATINNQNGENKIENGTLKLTFEALWPKFESNFKRILEENPPSTIPEGRTTEDILEEVLSTVREFDNKVSSNNNISHNPFEVFNINSNFYKHVERDVEYNLGSHKDTYPFRSQFATFDDLIKTFVVATASFHSIADDVATVIVKDILRKRGFHKFYSS